MNPNPNTPSAVPGYLKPRGEPRGGEEVTTADLPVLERYYGGLQNMPPSGGGGCHQALLGIANLGRAAGISKEQIASDLVAHVHGTREVSVLEIRDAVRKAFADPAEFKPRKRLVVDGAKLLRVILERGAGFKRADLWEKSPVRISWPVERDAVEVLQRLYSPDEHLFIGRKYDSGPEHVRIISEWLERFEHGHIPEHIVPNPLTGELGRTKDGRPSYRADSCVKRFRFAVLEFDTLPPAQQVHFWAGVKLPIIALVDSGGKSIHAWVRIDAHSAAEWTERVEEKLFDILSAVGIDSSCKNEARLSRMPGHFRCERRRWQRLLYLDPDGNAVQP